MWGRPRPWAGYCLWMLLNNVVQHCSGWVSALKVLTAYMADQRPLASHVTASKKKTAAQRAKSRNEFTTTTNHNQLSHNPQRSRWRRACEWHVPGLKWWFSSGMESRQCDAAEEFAYHRADKSWWPLLVSFAVFLALLSGIISLIWRRTTQRVRPAGSWEYHFGFEARSEKTHWPSLWSTGDSISSWFAG